ncbi:MAG: ABC transporter ATP-binding protein [Nitrososphaeria archaeon]
MNTLTVQGLGCKYNGEKPVLSGVSFFLKQGEAVGVVGASGSGKTTLAYCLMGIIPNKIDAEVFGKIFLNDVNVLGRSVKEIIGHINLIMQNYESQIFGLTVEEDIRFGLENLGLDEIEIERRLNWVLKSFRLEGYRRCQTSKLSGGLKQRLAIASTLVMDTDFLIVDDPTSNLDWNGVRTLRDTILYLKSIGKGILVLARRLKGLEECFDRVYSLNNGHALNARRQESVSIKLENGLKDHSQKRILGNGNGSIEVSGLWFKYNKTPVLKNVNLKIMNHTIVSIMGPNGSGKTTLVKHFNGLLKPTGGEVIVDGKNVKNYSPAQLAKSVGLVFQEPNRHIILDSVWEEASFGCKNLRLSFDGVEEALKNLNLYHVKDKPPYLLSTGEKVRLMIASAMATDPKILILDEPTTGQDERTLDMIEKAIFKMKENGKSVIVVTHDSDFALKVSDEVIILRDGFVIEHSPAKNILLDPEKVEKYEIEPPTLIEEEARKID